MLLTATGVPKNLLERIDITSSPVQEGHGNLRNEADFIIPKNTSVLAAANSLSPRLKTILPLVGLIQFFVTIQNLSLSCMKMKNIQGTTASQSLHIKPSQNFK